jgi:hypothetical protein
MVVTTTKVFPGSGFEFTKGSTAIGVKIKTVQGDIELVFTPDESRTVGRKLSELGDQLHDELMQKHNEIYDEEGMRK